MVARVVDVNRMAQKRIDAFRAKCINFAKTRGQFQKSFSINQDHIISRGAQQNSSLRSAIEPMHIAAVILGGKTNYATCRDKHPAEIAVDGILVNFKYVEFMTTQAISEITIPKLLLRVVLRDGSKTIAVVTVHPMQDKLISTNDVPEVTYEIW